MITLLFPDFAFQYDGLKNQAEIFSADSSIEVTDVLLDLSRLLLVAELGGRDKDFHDQKEDRIVKAFDDILNGQSPSEELYDWMDECGLDLDMLIDRGQSYRILIQKEKARYSK